MKIKIKLLVVSFLTIFFFSSCEDWLDVTASTEIKGEDQFNKEEGFKDALIGVYINMTSPDLYSKNMTWHVVDLLAQPYSYLSESSSYSVLQRYNYKHIYAEKTIDKIWGKQYNVICNINSALSFIDKNKKVLSQINYSIIKGELLGLRAFLHFDLLRLYGIGNIINRADIESLYAIPYQLGCSKEIPKQLTYNDFFTRIIEDVDDAIELLKEDPVVSVKEEDYYTIANKDGFYNKRENRMNYYAVEALKARVCMWFGGEDNIQKATVCAKDIIDNSFAHLVDSETYDFDSETRFYPENIFNLEISDLASVIDKYLIANLIGNYDALYFTSDVIANVYETDNTNIGIVDVRYKSSLKDDVLGKVCSKFKTDENFAHNNIIPLIRVSEMYYILAECNIVKDAPDIPKAVSYLNEVRNHRGILQNIPESSSREEILEELSKEYRKEFVGEGQLFFFYKRIGTTEIILGSGKKEVNDDIYILPYPKDEVEIGNRK